MLNTVAWRKEEEERVICSCDTDSTATVESFLNGFAQVYLSNQIQNVEYSHDIHRRRPIDAILIGQFDLNPTGFWRETVAVDVIDRWREPALQTTRRVSATTDR